jgi:hypothetical protein
VDFAGDTDIKENVRVVFSDNNMTWFDHVNYLRFSIESSKIHYIDNIWLKIELPESLFDLTDKQTYSLLNAIVILKIGLYSMSVNNMMTCIFNQICSGRNIKQNNNMIEIPLFNFDILSANKKEAYDSKQIHAYRGFPTISIVDTTEIEIEMPEQCIEDLKYSLICDGHNYGRVRIKERIDSEILFLYMQNTIMTASIKTRYFLPISGKNKIVKAILIYFSPLTYQINNQVPMIEKVTLYINDKVLLCFEADDLLDVDIFGIKIYVLPLSKEFSDWEHINGTFCSNGNVLKQLSPSGINSHEMYDMHLNIKFYNELESPDNYATTISLIHTQILSIFNGRCRCK